MNSVDRVNRETVGTVSRIGSPGTNSTVQFMFHSFLWDRVEKKRQSTLVFLPRESCGQRNVSGLQFTGLDRVRHDEAT